MLCFSSAFQTSGRAEALRAPERGVGATARASEAYGRLPLRFEANRGQADGRVKFLARGGGYTLFLSESGALMRLRGSASTLRLRLEGANRAPKVSSLGEMRGRVNYLVGADSHRWRTGVPVFEKVRYESVYKGVDMLYYGSEGRLEYDFVVAPGASPDSVRLKFDGARATRIEENGDLLITTDGGDVRQQRPLAYQEIGGERREVAARYSKDARGAVRFELGTYDRALPLVIDPVLVYSSYLGGLSTDQCLSIAVDSAGSAYVAGSTASTNFPGPGSFQNAKDAFTDAFVLKMSPDGKSFVYATYLGGNGDDFANAVAIDSAGNAYVGGQTGSGSFPRTPGAFQESKDGGLDAFIAKLNPTGTALVYSTYLGGGNNEQVYSIAVDAAGAAYVAGRTDSTTFTKIPIATRAGNPLLKSNDSGASWTGSGSGLTASSVNDVTAADASVLYAAAPRGVYKSTDGGTNWRLTGQSRTSTAPFNAKAVVVDPSNPNVIYAGTPSGVGVYKSTDGGTLYDAKGNGLFNPIVNTLAIDPSSPSTLYAGTTFGIYKTTNGGDSWDELTGSVINGSAPNVNKIVIDPTNTQTVYQATESQGVLKSTNGGTTWTPSNTGLFSSGFMPPISALALDSSHPSTLYAYVATFNTGGVYKTTDGGANWTASSNGLSTTSGGQTFTPTVNVLLVDPASPSTVYAGTSGVGIYRTTDAGANWAASNAGLTNRNILALASRAGSPEAIFAGASVGNDAFAGKLNPAGSFFEYMRFLGGAENDEAHGVAVGADGSAYVTGLTGSTNFPALGPPTARAGNNDAFVTKLNPAGSALLFSTYFGGASNDQGNRIAIDPAGGIYVVGNTASSNLPLANPARASFGGGGGDGFIAKFGSGIDVALTLSDAPDPVSFGSDLTYSIVVKNNGDLQATGVTVNDALPSGATLVSATTSLGTCTGTSTVVCNVGALGAGGSANITITVKPPAVRTINNAATVTLNETDVAPANNSATVSTNVDFADVAVSKSVLTGHAAPGSKAVYLLTVTNKSGIATGAVTLSDNLPADVTFLSCDSPHGVCGGAGGARTITFPSLDAGATESAVIVATVSPSAGAGAVVNNTTTASSAVADPDPTNNTATASFNVGPNVVAPKLNGKVLFVTFDGIYTVNADGTGLTKIHDKIPGSSIERFPVWSPDGTKIVFQSQVDSSNFVSYEFYVMDADGSNLHRISTNGTLDSRATWSPDCSHVAFIGRDFGIYAVNPDGTGETRVVPSLGIAYGLDWSSDGTRFVFYKINFNVFVMDVDGSNQRQLTFTEHTADGDTHDTDPLWSFDGARITFTRSTNNGVDTFAINPDGTGFSRLLNIDQIAHGQISPDGTKLLYQTFDGMRVSNLAGSGQPVSLGGGSDPRWQALPNANPTPTPTPTQTFTISGRVTRPDGSAGTAVVKLSGTRTASLGTDENGNYTFINLPRGGSYTLTPVNNFSREFITYAPGSRSVGDLEGNVTGFDFVQQNAQHTIRGRIVNPQGQPLPGVTVTLVLNGQRSTTTDTDGSYSFPINIGGDGYSIQPFLSSYSFDPVRAVLPTVTGDVTVNFVGTPFSNARGIGGRVVDAAGNSIVGIPVTLSGARNAVVKTDANGSYGFVNLPTGQTYTVTPSTAEGFTFSPPQQTFANFTFDSFASFNATATQPVAQFASADVTVAENARSVELTVTRVGDTAAAASVDYETSDVTASERSDYIAASGTVRFAKGESSKTFRLLVTDDNLLEGERLFKVTLTGGSGVRVGAANVATVHITEDDSSASVVNPIDSSAFFVTQHYGDFLNREPDAAGLAFWTNEIESCGANAQCREVKRVNVSAAFFLSMSSSRPAISSTACIRLRSARAKRSGFGRS